MLGIVAGHRRERTGRADGRHVARRAAQQRAGLIDEAQGGQAENPAQLDLPEGRDPIGVRNLGDRRNQSTVLGGDVDHVTAGERGAPDGDPVRIHALQAACEGDGAMPVAVLPTDVDELTRLAVAAAQVAIVEGQCRVPCRAEALGVGVKPPLLQHSDPVPQDDARGGRIPGRRRPQPGGALLSVRREADVLAHSYASASIFAASSKSFAVRPPAAWFVIETFTLSQEISRSG